LVAAVLVQFDRFGTDLLNNFKVQELVKKA
jgi:hypothetical protein